MLLVLGILRRRRKHGEAYGKSANNERQAISGGHVVLRQGDEGASGPLVKRTLRRHAAAALGAPAAGLVALRHIANRLAAPCALLAHLGTYGAGAFVEFGPEPGLTHEI